MRTIRIHLYRHTIEYTQSIWVGDGIQENVTYFQTGWHSVKDYVVDKKSKKIIHVEHKTLLIDRDE